MKRTAVIILMLGFLIASVACVSKTAAQTGSSYVEEARVAKRKEMDLRARQVLKSQEWKIYLAPIAEPRDTRKKTVAAGVEADVLTFTEGTVKSQNLSGEGYSESNFSLTIQDDGAAVWETMQVNAKNDLVFLKGELRGSMMKGVVSMQPVKGARKRFSFSTMMPQ